MKSFIAIFTQILNNNNENVPQFWYIPNCSHGATVCVRLS